jgi:hypothetical protein
MFDDTRSFFLWSLTITHPDNFIQLINHPKVSKRGK